MIEFAVQISSGTSLDRMIRLWYRPALHGTTPPEIPNLRNELYSNGNDLASMFRGQTLLRADAATFIPRQIPPADQPMVAEQMSEALDSKLLGDESSAEALVNVTKAQNASEEEHAAARVLQHRYRQHLRRKIPSSESTLRSLRRSLFDQFALESQSASIQDNVYRVIFRGPLTHALLCADKIQRWIYNSKQKAKRQLAKMKSEDFEDIRARQTKSECSNLGKG
jgi:hypothetical protein